MVVVYLGNPMNSETKVSLSSMTTDRFCSAVLLIFHSTQHSFDLRFKLVRGRTEGIGRPLQFVAVVNSTSSEVNLGKPN